MKLKLRQLHPNPFWPIDTPFDRKAVDAIKNNLYPFTFTARKVGGYYQITHNHFYLFALEELHHNNYEIEVDVQEISDQEMKTALHQETALKH